ELCDGLDNDCANGVDDGLTFVSYYEDTDGDTYGDPNVMVSTCDGAPSGYVINNTDCDDSDINVNPGVTEILDNGIDDDCNPATLDSSADVDDDGDGFSENQGDCDDTKDTIYPGATETEDNGIDEDCDGSDLRTWYQDSDGDNFGNSGVSQTSNSQPSNYVLDNTDCDDTE
uniref:MopE-related protein n=1 Tax=Seonamhaeicola maritimus TaxID=2591822 RepID=UPI0024945E9A